MVNKTFEINHVDKTIYGKIYNYDLQKKKVTNVILACHGFGSSKNSVSIEKVAEKFTEYNIPIISFDWPGHGQSKEELTIKNCKQTLNIIKQYIEIEYPNAEKNLYGSSFGAYMILLNLLEENNNNYKNFFFKSPAIKMDKIFKTKLLEESYEKFKKRGYTIKKTKNNLKIPYVFYQELIQNKITIEKLQNLKNEIMIFHGTMDDISLIEDVKNSIPSNFKIIELTGAPHSFSGEYLKKMIDVIQEKLNVREDILLNGLDR